MQTLLLTNFECFYCCFGFWTILLLLFLEAFNFYCCYALWTILLYRLIINLSKSKCFYSFVQIILLVCVYILMKLNFLLMLLVFIILVWWCFSRMLGGFFHLNIDFLCLVYVFIYSLWQKSCTWVIMINFLMNLT
jgi:hypothetical protein